MDAARFAKVRELFDAASELSGAEREEFLSARAADAEVRAAVESLLASHERAGDFLSRPAGELILEERDGADPMVGFALASYRITGVLGEGGMGAVYRAQQESPGREVALKVIRGGWSTPGLRRRFAQEAATLGKLRHPGIASIYEAGSAPGPDGRDTPYFAMELVEGPTLSAYASGREVREKILLVAMVCDAAHHAHQKGVIHRDLKPANILVEDHAGDSARTGTGELPGVQPKILDFGVARLVEPDGAMATMRTDPGQIIGTLAYMAPEQIKGDVDRIDTRADVYALGVILYELLAGRLPFSVKGRSIAEAARIIEDQEPAALGAIDRVLRGDIETIVAKAMEKDPERRYASAAELAGDLRRFLADLPINASPATTAYKLRKFAARHTALVGGVAAAFVLLVAGVVGTSVGLVRAREATRLAEKRAIEAEIESRTSQRTSDFLASVLSSADPAISRGRELTVREVIDDAAAMLAIELSDEPEVALRSRITLCQTYLSLARLDEAKAQAEEAMKLAELSSGGESLSYARALGARAAVARAARLQGESVTLSRASFDLFARLLPADDVRVARAKVALADALSLDWKFDDAKALLREARPVLDAARDASALRCTLLLATMLSRRVSDAKSGETAEAERLMEDALAGARSRGASGELDVSALLLARGDLRRRDQRIAEAEPDYRVALAIRQRVYPAHHPSTTSAAMRLAAAMSARGAHRDALEILTPIIEALRAQKRTGDAPFAQLVGLAGTCAGELGRHADAALYHEEALVIHRTMSNRVMQSVALTDLGAAYVKLERFADAELALREAMALSGGGHSAEPMVVIALAAALDGQGKHAEAAEALRPVIGLLSSQAPGSMVLLEAMRLRAEQLRAAGLLQEAEAQEAAIERLQKGGSATGRE
ncbi:MAG: serine/threonine protein kinase [Phycisphaerales bacterium]|jgi:serine/threonine protein kinase|nr:serine/threonine protein kinase [Phycisphaerales bacterium]